MSKGVNNHSTRTYIDKDYKAQKYIIDLSVSPKIGFVSPRTLQTVSGETFKCTF